LKRALKISGQVGQPPSHRMKLNGRGFQFIGDSRPSGVAVLAPDDVLNLGIVHLGHVNGLVALAGAFKETGHGLAARSSRNKASKA